MSVIHSQKEFLGVADYFSTLLPITGENHFLIRNITREVCHMLLGTCDKMNFLCSVEIPNK